MKHKLLSILALIFLLPACASLHAAANPKTLWAPKEPALLTVVVHRADAAQVTATEVERLLTATPTDAQSKWPAQTQLAPDLIHEQKQMFAEHPYYRATKLRILPAVIWARSLEKIQGGAAAHPSLLAAIAPDLAQSYAQIGARVAEIAAIEASIAEAELSADDEKQSDAVRATKKKEIEALELKRDQAEARVQPARDAFIEACKKHAASAPAEQRDVYGLAAVNLRQAVDDAEVANGAAILRYGFAVRHFKDALIEQAKASASDYIFERTAKRLVMSGFTFELTFEVNLPRVA